MRLMLLALVILVAMIPSALLSLILIKLMPHIPMLVLMLLNLLIIVGSVVVYRRKRIAFYTSSGEPGSIPSWMQNKGLVVFLVIGSLLGSGVLYMSNKAELYIDNGTDHAVKIALKHEGSFDVPAHGFVKKTVVIGDNEIKYEGKTRQLSVTKEGNWVFNIDTANTYVRTSVVYQSKSIFSKKGDATGESMPDFKMMTGEFFHAETDFMFDAPDEIRGERGKSGPVTKTVLLRIPSEDMAEEETDSVQHQSEVQ